MTQPTYAPAAVAELHAIADRIAADHLPAPQYARLYRHGMATAQFEAAAAEHSAEIKPSPGNPCRHFMIEFTVGGIEVTLTCFEGQ